MSSSARSSAQEAEIPGRPDDSGEEVSDSTSEGVDPPITISASYTECLSRFNMLIALVQKTVAGSEVQELGSRLQIWAGNHGAHRSHSDRLSLDYRLREAFELHQEVRDHFKDLIQAIDDAIITISGGDKTSLPDLSYDSSSGSESSLTSSQKAVIGDPVLRRAQSPSLTMQNTLQSIEDIITSLYKFSITIQNPANRDRTARAAKIGISFWSQFDLRHVQDKFPQCSNERLIRNLAQANTKRRQLFAYHKRHQQKIQNLPESSPQDVTEVHTGQLDDALDQKVSADSIPTHPATPTVNTGNTRLTQTTVSTIRPPLVNIAVSVSERSQRTNISNGPLSASQKLLTIPPPPGVAWDFDIPFVCPYCYLVINPKDQRHWETHVLDDLRPYVCTFGDCVSAAILYDRFSEWKAHELEVHRREWFCNFCKATYDTRIHFTEHINLRHKSLIKEDDPLLLLCERTSTRDEDCPLCANFKGKVHSLQEHLAMHLRQLALYTLPKVSVDDTGNDQGNDQAESDVVIARAQCDSSNDNTSQGLRNLSDEKFEDFLETGWFTPPDSPFPLEVKSNTSISWDFCRIPLATLENEPEGSDYQKLVQSFGQNDGHQNKMAALIEVETITFLILTFSLLLATADEMKKHLETLGWWYKFRTRFIFFMNDIYIQNRSFLLTIESLMRSFDLPENVLQPMIEGTRESDKYWTENPLLIKERLGSSYPIFLSTLHAMRGSMEEILDMLYLNRDGSIIWVGKEAWTWDDRLYEIYRSFIKKEERSLKILKMHNRTLRFLFDGLEISGVKGGKKTFAMGNALVVRSKELVNIHGLFMQALNCSCSGGHLFAIEACPHPISDNNLECKLLVSTTASPNRVLKVKIYEDSDKGKTKQVQVVGSLCLALASWEDEHSIPIPYILGYLSGSGETRYVIGTYDASGVFPTCSLVELLGGMSIKLPRRVRFGIATSIAFACLQVGSTPWAPKTGMSKYNIIFSGAGPGARCNEPYLAPSFTPVPTATPDIETQPRPSSIDNARRDLEYLGILLLELCFGKAIEDCPFWMQHLIEGLSHERTKTLAAGEWVNTVSAEAGPEMEHVIRCCLLCQFEEQPDWASAAFVQEVFETVVEPLSALERMLFGVM